MPASLSESRILIVEDEQIIAHSIGRSLLRAGYSVPAMATSAQEAFELIERTKPDLVLMDIHIQGQADGIETARIIRERYHLPVIYLTAHADAATLERAKATEPFGYLVKPLNHANLSSSIEMALYRHKMNRQMEEQKALLSTILESIEEAVIVTNAAGEVEFLNRAAERLTEWPQEDALGKAFDTVVRLEGADSSLLSRALLEKKPVQIPRETILQTKSGAPLFVDGQIAVSQAKERAAGAVITLHDGTLRRQEEQQVRQEQKMLSVGQLANDVAGDFYGLFEVIASCGDELTRNPAEEQSVEHCARIIGQASSAGSSMARQLLELGRSRGARPERVQFNQVLEEGLSLYKKLCGESITFEMQLAEELDLILSHPIYLEKLVLNLVLSASRSMPSGGRILLRTSNIDCPDEKGGIGKRFVRLVIGAERDGRASEADTDVVRLAPNPELTVAIVNAIVTVGEGSITTSRESEDLNVTEVLLPSVSTLAPIGSTQPRSLRPKILTVGLASLPGGLLHKRLEDAGMVVFECANAQEALLISDFCEEGIDLLILDGRSVPSLSQRRVYSLISSRWPAVKVLALATEGHPVAVPQATILARPYEMEDLVRAAERLIGKPEFDILAA